MNTAYTVKHIQKSLALLPTRDGQPSRPGRKYKVVIAYDGTGFSGWQFQENAVGVQQVVEEALEWIERAPVRVYGSSRTDAGVHARGFVAHFELTKPVPPKKGVIEDPQ